MKKHFLEDVNYVDAVLEEAEENGKKVPYLLVDMMVADRWNANKRRYPLHEIKNAIPSFIEAVDKGLGHAIMLADHPVPGQQPSIKDASGFIKSVHFDEKTKTVRGKVQLLETPYGNTILAIVKAGGKVGISSRGVGELIEAQMEDGGSGFDVKNLKLKGMDFVVFPSLGSDATSRKLIYEQFQEEIQKEIEHIFPGLSEKLTELNESIDSIKARLDSEDVVSLKSDLLESVMKLVSCSCETPSSDVFINKEQNEVLETHVDDQEIKNDKKEDIEVMKTVTEFQEQYPELFAEVKDTITKEVTEAITKEVTDTLMKDAETKIAELKEALRKEVESEYESKYTELEAKVAAATEKVEEAEKEFNTLKEDSQPYFDILEGLVTFMREKGLLINEDEVFKGSDETDKTEAQAEESAQSEELKTLTDEMSKVINDQKAKLDEAIARIDALETEKKKLEEDKEIAEQERLKAEINVKVQEIISREQKYASILQPKLEKATTMEEVEAIYKAEKAFIEQIEKLNVGSSEMPAGEGKVAEEEVVKDETKETVITESETDPTEIKKSLQEYQRRLAGIVIKKSQI